ncbi:MAG: ABC transporter permease subunit [Planctomycetaceae bacterium]|nr:ABC transporter permease subunit [Planctomycetales bacterium]MCB9922106.1 ABC transporter permease subunit [Planctomycetaceae bacterium]
MNKYLAIIKDSFREALASRVLWLLLVLITLLLLVIAPLGYHQVVTWQLSDNDVRGWENLMHKVRTEGRKDEPSPSRRIFVSLDEKLQDRLVKVKLPGIDEEVRGPFEFMGVADSFKKALNKLIESSDFYAEESFASVPMLSDELRELKKAGPESLPPAEIGRFNRLLVEASYPDLVRSSPPTSIQLKYGWWEFFDPFPLRRATLQEALQTGAAFVMSWFVGAVGVLVAILVTSPIVPQMFDPGSLHLLLSKPISRWLLFLAKFCGGCAFILICASYLVTGLWIILGVRFGVWDPKLLLGIPIYLFVFAVYYSVSSLVGVVYRSPIVCIVLTVLFWGICFLVGLAKVTFENTIWSSSQITRVFEADGSLVAVNELGVAHTWDDANRQWREIFVTPQQKQARGIMIAAPELRNMMQPVGPVYDQRHERLLAALVAAPQPGVRERLLTVGAKGDDWEPRSENTVPTGAQALFLEPSGDVLLVASIGLFRLTGDPLEKKRPVKLFGIQLPLKTAGPFENVGPADSTEIVLTPPSTAAMSTTDGALALYTRGRVKLLERDEHGSYQLLRETRLDGEERQPVVLAFGGSTIVLGRQDGRIQAIDATTFGEQLSTSPEGPNQARFITASPDGRWFAVLLHNGDLWIYDAENKSLTMPAVAGQGAISCAVFSNSGQLYVADQAVRVISYEMPDFTRSQTYSPRLGIWMRAYRYGLLPLYTLFPKPGELGTTFGYLMSGKETQSAGSSDENLSASQRDLDPWTPLWSSALFMCVVLGIACAYIEWQEF